MPQILRTVGEFRPSLASNSAPSGRWGAPVGHGLANEEPITLAPGHVPTCKSHPHGCGGLRSHFHAPICTNDDGRNLPVRKIPADIGIWPTLQALLAIEPQMKLANLAPGHPPRSNSHPCGSGGLRSHFHAPIPAINRRILPLPRRQFGPSGEGVGPLMVMDSQMKLINLAPGHPPTCKNHHHGCGGLMSHFHAPICTNDEQNLPSRKLAADMNLAHVGGTVGHVFANRPQKPCPWTSPNK